MPYPYDAVSAGRSVLLYFELYHLRQGAAERTRYTITYETTRHVENGFFGRLFGDDTKKKVTSTSSEYSGERRWTEEYIQLDFEYDLEQRQTTEITVRATDEHTGQQVERSIELTLVPSEKSTL